MKRLLEAFENAARGESSLLLVTGYSGSGKSALINELQRPITRKNGFFISGKHDQYQHDIPYSALLKCLRELVGHILTGNDAHVSKWREKILSVAGVNGAVLNDIIPEMDLVIGPQEPVPPCRGFQTRTASTWFWAIL